MATHRLGACAALLIGLSGVGAGAGQAWALPSRDAPTERPPAHDGASTAEGLALSDYAVRQAALRLADDIAKGVGATDQPVWLIVGAEPPTTAGWLAYQHRRQAVADDLAVAIRQWDQVKDVDIDRRGKTRAPTAPSLAPTALATPDAPAPTSYPAADARLSPGQLETRAIVAGALRQRKVLVDYDGMALADAPTAISDDLRTLRNGDYRQAQARYDAYTAKLVAQGGETGRMNPTILDAGKALRGAIDNFDAFERSLFAPVDGVLPATEIARQKQLFERRANQPLLYVTNVRSNLTTVDGRGSKPVALRAAALIDYGLVKDGAAPSFSTAAFKTDEVAFDDAATFIGWGYSDQAPALPKHKKRGSGRDWGDDDDWW